MQHTNTTRNTTRITIIGLMSALVFVGTYIFKIPTAFGYTHLGDCILVLTACLFGTKCGILAGATGAGLSDFIGGYAAWILPTILLKSLWSAIIGATKDKLFPNKKYSWLAGSIIGAVFHTLGYVGVNLLFYGPAAAAAEFIPNTIQSAVGVIFGGTIYMTLSKSPFIRELQAKLL